MFKWLMSLLGVIAFGVSASATGIAINGGRVMDPESGLDAERNLLIRNGEIVRISRRPQKADRVIDATGLVVAPGFIDLHAHGQDPVSNRFQAADGVTTALELEIGVEPLADWIESRRGKAVLNYGASVSHLAARFGAVLGMHAGNPVYADNVALAAAPERPADAALSAGQVEELHARLRAGVAEGALGVGIGLSYTPGASAEEIVGVFQVAAESGVPVFIHLRQARQTGGDLLLPVQEAIAAAAATGASLHIVHLNSSADELAKSALMMIRGARRSGLDITSEVYPYTAGSTRLESALFDHFAGDYGDLQWVATGERLSQQTFARYRAEGGWVIIHGRSEDTSRWLLSQPDLMIASDGIPFVGGFSHPRSAGTFSRVIGRYARDAELMPLMEALTKMTIMPARRLESIAPAMARKGRIKQGADADITIFDPATIVDNATYTQPAQTSTGIRYVLVAGTLVVDGGEPVPDVFPGQPVLAGAVD